MTSIERRIAHLESELRRLDRLVADVSRRDRRPNDLLTTTAACDYLCYRGKHRLRSVYRFLEKKGVRTRRRFRTILIKKSDLDRALGVGPREE